MPPVTSFDIVQGIWNPAEKNWSWVTVENCETSSDAYKAIDRIIAASLGLGFGDKLTKELIDTYAGPPLHILRTVTNKVYSIGSLADPFAAKDAEPIGIDEVPF